MTNQPPGPKPVRNLRVTDEIWDTALKNATEEGRTLTEVITSYLKRYNAAAAGKRTQAEPVPPVQPTPEAPFHGEQWPHGGFEAAPEPPRRAVPTELPDHAERIVILERVDDDAYARHARDERAAFSAGLPKFSGETITAEALSLGVFIRARAAGDLDWP